MRKFVSGLCVRAALIVSIGFLAAEAYAGQSEERLARALADYLVAGRTVIAVNQAIINDPSKGGNRFTPGLYDAQVRYEYLKMTGTDIWDPAKAGDDFFSSNLRLLHESAMQVIAAFQSRINRPGEGFKGVNPAMFGTSVGQEFSGRSGIRLKQTSMKYRATYNQPDSFEAGVLSIFESSEKSAPYFEETTEKGKRFARYMVPLYITSQCLACHGEPAGELDMTGRAREGYKEGQLRGGISVIVPVP